VANDLTILERRDIGLKKPIKLKPGQTELYQLICDCLQVQDKKITREKLLDIYTSKVMRSTQYEVYTYNYETKQGVYVFKDKPQNYIESDMEQWFIRSLGILVKKGYVTIIPLIDLGEVANV
jgi:hypothetical protein